MQPASEFLTKDEINYFEKAMQPPERPIVAIIEGVMANTFLRATAQTVR